MRLTVVIPYPWGMTAGQRYRIEQWLSLAEPGRMSVEVLPLLSRRDHELVQAEGGNAAKVGATVRAGLRRARQTLQALRADVVFLYREAFPLGPAIWETLIERRLPVVYDFDDAIWLGDTSPQNAWVRRFKSPHKVSGVIASAACTTVGNQYLAAYARQYNSSVTVVPTTIDVARYRPPTGHRPARSLVRVGWIGSRTTSRYLAAIAPAMRRMVDELPVELVVIGDPNFRLPDTPRVTVLPWSPAREREEVGSFDIGLMPLPDDAWTRGKCGFKALFYMSLGVPPVVSPVGANREIVVPGANGLWAEDGESWVAAVAALVADPDRRASLGATARATVVQSYSGQRWAPVVLDVIERAAESRA